MSISNDLAITNFFRVTDLDGLQRSLEPFSIQVLQSSNPGYYYLSPQDEARSFSQAVRPGENDEDDEVYLSFEENILPFVPEGEVIIAKEIYWAATYGANRVDGEIKYIGARSSAYVRLNGEVQSLNLSLNDITKLASDKFGIEQSQIHMESPPSLDDEESETQYPRPRG